MRVERLERVEQLGNRNRPLIFLFAEPLNLSRAHVHFHFHFRFRSCFVFRQVIVSSDKVFESE